MTTFGLLIFEQAEELDFVGPWEVFTASAAVRAGENTNADAVVTIAERTDPLRCNKGLRVIPDYTLDDHPPLDVVLVPGGTGTRREVNNPTVIDMALWLIGRIYGRPHARLVRRKIQYEPAPPYMADEPLAPVGDAFDA